MVAHVIGGVLTCHPHYCWYAQTRPDTPGATQDCTYLICWGYASFIREQLNPVALMRALHKCDVQCCMKYDIASGCHSLCHARYRQAESSSTGIFLPVLLRSLVLGI